MTRDIEVQDPAAIVFDHEETAKHRNVTLTTVKKINATITSRWFRRNVANVSQGLGRGASFAAIAPPFVRT